MTINSLEIKEYLINLKDEEKIFVDISVDDCNKFILLSQQIESCEILFRSFFNNTTEVAANMNIQNFINAYTNLRIGKNNILQEILLKNLGTEVYELINSPNYNCMLNTEIHNVIISKRKIKCC